MSLTVYALASMGNDCGFGFDLFKSEVVEGSL